VKAPRALVFNADDFGFGAAENAGVMRANATGIVREASLGVTGPAFDRAAELARDRRGSLGVGLHLSFTFGRALTGPIPHLTDADGRFLSLGHVLAATLLRRPPRARVRAEVRAQLERLDEAGIDPTHLNGHHHAHLLPVIRDAVLELLAERPNLHVRVPRGAGRSPRGAFLSLLGRSFALRARLGGVRLRSLPCYGLGQGRSELGALLARMRLPAEWVVHPTTAAGAEHGGSGLGRGAEPGELAWLESPELAELLQRWRVEPASYAELATMR